MTRLSLGQKSSLFNALFGEIDHSRHWLLSPPADVREVADGYQFSFDIPGMKRDEIQIDLSDRILSVSGERKSTSQSEKDGYHHHERVFGSFQRCFELPSTADTDHIDAKYADGVLDVFVKKSQELKSRRIELS